MKKRIFLYFWGDGGSRRGTKNNSSTFILEKKRRKQAGAELCQAQKCLVGFEIKFKQN